MKKYIFANLFFVFLILMGCNDPNIPTKQEMEKFPAPSSLIYNNLSGEGAGAYVFGWYPVSNADDYRIYVKSKVNGQVIHITPITWEWKPEFNNYETYIGRAKYGLQFSPHEYFLGVRAVSSSGLFSDIRWSDGSLSWE